MSPLFVFLPGTLCDARVWASARDLLPNAAPAAVANLRLDDSIADMAHRTLAAHEGSLVAIGFSMGAMVALEMARLAPARIAGLVLAAVNPAADLPERAAVKPRQQAEAHAGRLAALIANELKPAYFAEANRGDLALRDLVMAMGLDLGAEVFVRQSEALRTRADLRPTLANLPMPVLLLAGAEDMLCLPEWHRAAAAAIPRATLAIVEGAGHMLPLERPGRVADAVSSWLAAERIMPCPVPIAS